MGTFSTLPRNTDPPVRNALHFFHRQCASGLEGFPLSTGFMRSAKCLPMQRPAEPLDETFGMPVEKRIRPVALGLRNMVTAIRHLICSSTEVMP